MEEINQFKTLPFSTQLMIISLFIGTLLFTINIILPKLDIIIIIGLIYTIVALLVNSITLIYLLLLLLFNLKNAKSIGIQILILLINLPIATLYTYFVIYK
jgi:hypothetical protein